MNLTGWRFLLFAVVGAAAIIILAGIGVPGGARVDVDRHTGEAHIRVRSVADAYHEARAQGDATKALQRLEAQLPRFPDSEVLRELHAILKAEFGRPPDDHPDAAAIRAEEARAESAREELRRRIRERIDKQPLLALLSALEADESQAAAVEGFFAPLATLPRSAAAPGKAGPDERAVYAAMPVDFLELAKSFHARARTRARARWLLRAYAAGSEAFRPLYDAYVQTGRLPEAFLLLGTELQRTPDDAGLWQERGKLAGWLSLPRAEADAHERLLAADDTRARRRRLAELYGYLHDPAKALPHAIALTEGSTNRKDLEWPVNLALQAGRTELALDLLTTYAERSDDPLHWRERIIAIAWQDMRVNRVIREYEILHARYPDGSYEAKLEGVYRRRNLNAPLAALLSRRLAKNPDDRKLELEVLRLHVVLGRQAKVREIVKRRIERIEEPRLFFEHLQIYAAIGVEGLADYAVTMASSPALEAKDATDAIDELKAMEGTGWLTAATIIARRFVQMPAARALLVEQVDRLPDDVARAAAAEKLSREFPEQPELLKVWLDRASWAGHKQSEISARELWARHEPGDLANRRALVDLYSGADAAASLPHWRRLANKAGLKSPETLLLVDALLAAGEAEEAMEWLARRAHLPGTSIEERLEVADQLFGSSYADRALLFYMAVLDDDPKHAEALLRVGQIRSWTGDARGAIPFLRRRLAVSGRNLGEVRFYLGEALWSTHHRREAEALHRAALEDLTPDTATRQVMRAKILARFGRFDEARPLFEQAIAGAPDNVDVLLDYADAMIGARRTEDARALTERATKLAPHRARTLRARGNVAILERRYEDAAAIFHDVLQKHGSEAGVEAELGRAEELAGRSRAAHAAYKRSLTLQPDNRDLQQAVLRMWDDVAKIFHANFELRRTGDDTIWRLYASGSAPLKNGRTRLAASLAATSYDATGFSAQEVVSVHVAVSHRIARTATLGGGLMAYAGAPGDAPVGGWLELRVPSSEPHREFGVRLNLHTLLDDPAGAVSLGGRSTGVTVYATADFTRRLWGLAQAKYSSLSIENDGVRNGHVDVAATIGYRLIQGDTRTGEPLDVGRSALPGLIGSDLQGSPRLSRSPLLSLWVTYQAIRLLDDKLLATYLPIGESFDYLSVGARTDVHLANGLGLSLEGYAGSDLAASNFYFGAEAALTWRPSPRVELTIRGAYGTAIGRADDADTFVFRALFSYRW